MHIPNINPLLHLEVRHPRCVVE